ncbi:MAG TPA: amidohydrolase family protein [Vicinamibacterales bacterium]|nr:amidohydrolase family protein [Vicinamibacterales bacterium]
MRTTRLLVLVAAALLSARGVSAQTTAFVGGRVIDGTGKVIDNGTVVVTGAKITAVGPASTPVPAGATRVDLKGKTILPGLINAHGHVPSTTGLRIDPASYTRDNLLRQLRTYAMYGVTTVFSLGDDQAAGFTLRDENGTATDRARIFVAGAVIGGNTADEARANTAAVVAMKPDVLKIRVDDNLGSTRKMPEAAWRAVIAEADARKLPLAVHIYYLADAKATLDAGADLIAHSVRDVPVDDQFINSLKSRDVCYSPTLTREISTFIYDSTPPWVDDPFFLKGVENGIPEQLKDPKRHEQIRNSPAWKSGQQYKASLEVAKKNLKTLVDRGVRIAMGTDTGPPARFQGFFEHLELDMMVESGMTPMQVIVSATGDAARCHGKTGQLGTLAAGAAADLLIVNGNPLDNIRNLRNIDAVWINGKKGY